jgi:signal transduction histidine kinase/Tfp pilus assembly protein PilF
MRKFICVLLLFFTSCLFSQSKTNELIVDLSGLKEDSLKVKKYYAIAEKFLKIDSTKCNFYSKKGLELSKKINWIDGIAQYHLLAGRSYSTNNNYTSSLNHFKQALNKTKNKNIHAQSYFYIGENNLQENKYALALGSFHKSLKLYESIKDKIGITRVLLSIGSLYTGFGKNKEALESYNKALKLSKQNNNLNQELALRGIGTVYYNTSEYEKSLSYFEKSLALIKSKKDTNLESRLLSDIALVYLELGSYQKAIDYSKASLKTDPSIMNKIHNVAFSYGVIGDSYVELAREQKNNPKLIDSAVSYLEKAVQLHKEFKSLRGLYDDYRSIYEAQKLKGNSAKALEYFELCSIYKDSIYNSDNKETIKNLEDKRAIELRDREIKINKLQMEAKEKQKWFLLAGIVFLGIIGGLFFYQSQNRKKNNEKLQLLNAELDEANKTKTRFFSILNHDLRSPVTNLIHFLHLQKDNPDLLDDENKKRLENKNILGAENLLTSMEDILLWSKGQMENFKPQPKTILISSIFDDIKSHFSSEENIQFVFENRSNLSLVTDENYLKTIMRNLTGNAVKALENFVPSNRTDSRAALGMTATIIWKAFQEPVRMGEIGTTILSITDNGKGASDDQFKALYDDKEVVGIKTGLGLHLIRDLAKAINCEISVKSKINEGTTITLKF